MPFVPMIQDLISTQLVIPLPSLPYYTSPSLAKRLNGYLVFVEGIFIFLIKSALHIMIIRPDLYISYISPLHQHQPIIIFKSNHLMIVTKDWIWTKKIMIILLSYIDN